MICIDDYDIFKNASSTLKESSKSTHNGTTMYMSESMLPVVDFDNVKDQYVRDLSVFETPASNDALYIDSNGELFFIEFKAGKMAKKIFEVRLKLFDSLLILSDIIGKGISFNREYLNYILVFDESINIDHDDVVVYQDTPSREWLNSRYIKKGDSEYIRFRLRRFQRLYVKRVFTVGRDEFQDRFAKVWAAEQVI